MKTRNLVIGVYTTLLYICMLIGSIASYEDIPSLLYKYTSFPEIQKHCNPYLTSAVELKPDDSRSYRLKNELSFSNGDWEQVSKGSPLMPFDDTDVRKDGSFASPPLKLVSFEVKDVNPVHHSRNSVSLGGIMALGISRNSSLPSGWYSKFFMRPGLSVLPIVFEGVYVETEEFGGERLLCLLGNSTLPYSNSFEDSFGLANNYGVIENDLPHDVGDGKMLLVLHYPKTFNLTNRAVRGEMRSLNGWQSFMYFDKVSISALLGPYWKYQFHPDLLKSKTCSPLVYQDAMIEDGVKVFNGSGFCRFLRYVSGRKSSVMPNYNFKARYSHHSKLDGILFGKELAALGLSYENISLVLQHVKCEPDTTRDSNHSGTAKVFAVLRAVPARMLQQEAASMTGLSGLTITAEGMWTSSSGQLCMVGCQGEISSGLEGCTSQISLYFPLTLSIKQRSIILGSISSFDKEPDSYFPLLFDSVMRPRDEDGLYGWYGTYYLSYNYSIIDRARASRNRSQSLKVLTFIKQLFLRYPALKDRGEFLNCLNHLSAELALDSYAILNSHSVGKMLKTFIQLEVISLGPLFGEYTHRYTSDLNDMPANLKDEIISHEILNVSLHLTFRKAPFETSKVSYNNVSELFLEGLYDPLVGEMHLIGCRKIYLNSYVETDLQRGLDCLIDVKVQYPPENTQWLKNSMVKLKITSQRNEDDPLHFNSISLQALTVQRRDILEDVVFRQLFERILRTLMLTVMIGTIWSQLLYTKREVNTTPYLSLVMFAHQVLVCSLPLISDTEILFKSKELEYDENIKYRLWSYQLSFDIFDNVGRLLLLSALLLNARIFQMVSKQRTKQQRHGYSTLGRVIMRILGITAAVYIFGLLFVDSFLLLPTKDTLTSKAASTFQILTAIVEAFVDIAQDFFLLPQVFENFFRQINAASLRKVYYIGLTFMRLILHVYDSIRDPILDPYSEYSEVVDVDSAFYSNLGRTAVSVIIFTLAVVIHVQQSSSYQKISKRVNSR